MAPQIYLDSAIREWVLVPVFVAMFLFGVLRAQVSKVRAAPRSARGWHACATRGEVTRSCGQGGW
jgi:hypothetical protein